MSKKIKKSERGYTKELSKKELLKYLEDFKEDLEDPEDLTGLWRRG